MNAGKEAVMGRVQQLLAEQPEDNMHALAERIGLSYFTLRRWHEGLVAPSREGLRKLGEALSVSPVWLEFGVGDRDALPPTGTES